MKKRTKTKIVIKFMRLKKSIVSDDGTFLLDKCLEKTFLPTPSFAVWTGITMSFLKQQSISWTHLIIMVTISGAGPPNILFARIQYSVWVYKAIISNGIPLVH